MKIATMTWLRNYNYGTVLQAYALSKYLIDNGHDTFVIDYEGFKPVVDIEGEKSILSFFKEKVVSKRGAKEGNWNIYQENVRCFEDFINQHISVSERVSLKAELVALTKDLDAVICGSDQIWSPVFFDPHFFLDFVDDSNRVIAYAPSLGVSSVDSEHIKYRMKELLSRFKFLSLRETSGIQFINEYFGLKAELVVDPVFLLDKDSWSKVSDESSKIVSEPYMVTYFLGNTKEHWDAVTEFQTKYDLKNIIIPVQYSHLEKLDGAYDPISPSDFLRLIRDAEYVVTDSFHATAFSVIFQKKFVCFERFSSTSRINQNTRIYNLLHSIDMEKRICQYKTDRIPSALLEDFKIPLEKLYARIINSKEYLRNALDSVEAHLPTQVRENNQCVSWKKLVDSNAYCLNKCSDNILYGIVKDIIYTVADSDSDFQEEEFEKIMGGICGNFVIPNPVDYYSLTKDVIVGTSCGIETAMQTYGKSLERMIYIEIGCEGKLMYEMQLRLNKDAIRSDEIVLIKRCLQSKCCFSPKCYECMGSKYTAADISIIMSGDGPYYLFINTDIGQKIFNKMDKELYTSEALSSGRIEKIVSSRCNPIYPVFYDEMCKKLSVESNTLKDIYNIYLSGAENNKKKKELINTIERLVKKVVKLVIRR